MVRSVVAKLHRGKAAGLDSISAEHLIYCHPIISSVLSKLFNLLLISGRVPIKFGESYTVPIPKVKDVRTKAVTVDDFRGIAISPILSKIFEYCILDKFNIFLSSSANQFGFKLGSSCSQAVYTLNSIVERSVAAG